MWKIFTFDKVLTEAETLVHMCSLSSKVIVPQVSKHGHADTRHKREE
jgi:hypothetical protein